MASFDVHRLNTIGCTDEICRERRDGQNGLEGPKRTSGMPTESEDPETIRSLAITAEDVVAAAETNRTSDRTAVLRVIPPFSGRMRARLHVRVHDEPAEPDAIHIPPATLLGESTPDYPRPAATKDELRSDPDTEYTVERHRERHEAAVQEWRDALTDAIVERATIVTEESSTEVTVHVLG
jgi:hypothetical protein